MVRRWHAAPWSYLSLIYWCQSHLISRPRVGVPHIPRHRCFMRCVSTSKTRQSIWGDTRVPLNFFLFETLRECAPIMPASISRMSTLKIHSRDRSMRDMFTHVARDVYFIHFGHCGWGEPGKDPYGLAWAPIIRQHLPQIRSTQVELEIFKQISITELLLSSCAKHQHYCRIRHRTSYFP